MVHYVLYKFKEGGLTDNVINDIADTYEEIAKRYDGIENPQIYRNIVTREGNMDLMLTVEVRGLEELRTYLECEEHKAVRERHGHLLEQRFSFDHN